MSDRRLELLHLEDSPLDQELIERELKRNGLDFESTHVMDREAFSKALDTFEPDVILSDFSLPSFNGLEALRMAKEKQPEVPFIFVSGALGEERAVELLREGASDYILKDRLQRLAPAVRRAKEEAIARKEREQAEEALRYREQLEQIINRFTVNFVAASDSSLDNSIQQVLSELGSFIGAERIYLYMLNSERTHAEKGFEWRRPGLPARERDVRIRLDKFRWAQDRFARLESIFVSRPEELPPEAVEEVELFEQQRIESFLLVPIAPLGSMVGFLECEGRTEATDWTHETTILLRVAAEVLGNALLRVKTERELKEERKFLERVLECSGIVVVVLDETGRIVRVNQGFTEVTGFAEQACLGSLIFDLIVPDEFRDQARTDLRRVVEEGSLVDYEAPLETKSRERRLIRWRADVLSSDHGIQIVASGVDLTDLRRAEEQHLQLESQLAQAQRIESLGRVAANVTHEFNNVLMGIQPFADLISRSAGDDERLQSCANHISQSIQRGSRITREVLRFASPTKPVREHVRAGEWIRNAINSNRMLLGDRIEVALRIEQDHQISIDRSQLEQVVVNLLLNARDAMEEGGRVDITVSTPSAGETFRFGVVESPERSVWIEVRDQGPGVPAGIRDRLFEPFFTTKHKGTGLGLAVCHQIVHAHGGQIFVETELGQGTAFHLFLPRSE